jgi:UDP-GlcNAc:undecaprenyl-phosphate GlcNAc-1-phosphate transferase
LDTAIIGVLCGAGLLVLLNVWDDIHGLPPVGRLLAQIVIAVMVYVWGVRIEILTNPGGIFGPSPFVHLGWTSGPVTVLWIVLVTNALNWLDGLDGLAAGVAGISALTVAIMGTHAGAIPVAVTAACIAGSCLGFLFYNFNPARVFMGDTGAMCLGFMLACLSVLGAYKVPTAAAVFLPFLVLGVPVFDSTSAILKRILSGKNPLVGDRNHIHHRLVDGGLPVRAAVLIIYALSALLCLLALYLWWQ